MASAPATRAAPRIGVLALIIMLGSVVSRILGLVREQIAASLFGTGDAIAAFTIADNLQTLLFDLMVSGALQAALIPVFAQLAVPDPERRAEFRRVAGTLIVLATVVLGGVTVLGIVFAPALVEAMTWFSGDAGSRGTDTLDLTVRLVRICLPAALLLSIGTLLQAMLHALGRVTAPAFSTSVRNLAIVVAALVASSSLGVESMAWGTVIGALLIVLLQLRPLARAQAMPVLTLEWRHPALRQIVRLYGPVFLGLILSSLAIVIDRGLAWGAGENAIGAMRYATTLVQLVLGLIAAAIGLAALPTLSRSFSAGDEAHFRATLGRAMSLVTVLVFPATVGLAALGSPIVSLLFGYGEVTDAGLARIELALLGYVPGALAAAYDQVLIYAFYARQNTRLPVIVGVGAIGVYLVVAFALVERVGMIGLVIANSAQFIAHALVMVWCARSRFGWSASIPLARLVQRSAAASAAMGGAAFALWWTLDRAMPVADGTAADIGRRLALVIVPAGVAAMIYGVAVWPVCRAEFAPVIASLRARFRLAGR